MSMRTKSRGTQWGCWAILFLVGLAAYAIILRRVGSETSAWLILARQNVAAFASVSFVFGWLAYELRWDGIVRREEVEKRVGVGVGVGVGGVGVATTPTPPPTPPPTSSPGEAEWLAARQLRHSHVPTMEQDEEYLTLIKQSAELGYALALAKLGDYALNRHLLVEAYYWYSCARKRGMRNLDGRLRGIRLEWQRAGCPSPTEWYLLQDSPSHSIARALLDRDAGRNAKDAAAFLDSVGFQ